MGNRMNEELQPCRRRAIWAQRVEAEKPAPTAVAQVQPQPAEPAKRKPGRPKKTQG